MKKQNNIPLTEKAFKCNSEDMELVFEYEDVEEAVRQLKELIESVVGEKLKKSVIYFFIKQKFGFEDKNEKTK